MRISMKPSPANGPPEARFAVSDCILSLRSVLPELFVKRQITQQSPEFGNIITPLVQEILWKIRLIVFRGRQLCPHRPTGWYGGQRALLGKTYANQLKVWNSAVGAGIVIPPNTFHITQSPCLAETIEVFFDEQDLILLQIIDRPGGQEKLIQTCRGFIQSVSPLPIT